MSKRYYRVTDRDNEGAISFNGASGYHIMTSSNQFCLIYSTGMMGLYYDLTPEMRVILENQFPTNQ